MKVTIDLGSPRGCSEATKSISRYVATRFLFVCLAVSGKLGQSERLVESISVHYEPESGGGFGGVGLAHYQIAVRLFGRNGDLHLSAKPDWENDLADAMASSILGAIKTEAEAEQNRANEILALIPVGPEPKTAALAST